MLKNRAKSIKRVGDEFESVENPDGTHTAIPNSEDMQVASLNGIKNLKGLETLSLYFNKLTDVKIGAENLS